MAKKLQSIIFLRLLIFACPEDICKITHPQEKIFSDMERVLVTGASGFVGSFILERLRRDKNVFPIPGLKLNLTLNLIVSSEILNPSIVLYSNFRLTSVFLAYYSRPIENGIQLDFGNFDSEKLKSLALDGIIHSAAKCNVNDVKDDPTLVRAAESILNNLFFKQNNTVFQTKKVFF